MPSMICKYLCKYCIQNCDKEKYACVQYGYNLPKCVLDLVKSASAEDIDPENYCLLTIIEMVLSNISFADKDNQLQDNIGLVYLG